MNDTNEKKKCPIPLFYVIIGIILIFDVGYYLFVTNIKGLADWHRSHVFRWNVNIWSRVTNIWSGSVGEWMIILAILLAVWFLIALILGLMHHDVLKRIRKVTVRVVVGAITFAIVTETMNCFVQYQCSTLLSSWTKEIENSEDSMLMPTEENLEDLYIRTVERANQLSKEFLRDEQGYIIVEQTSGELMKDAREALHGISDEFPLLKGYYPDVKEISSSDFMTQQYLLGIYFPFSLEANYNSNIYITNQPATFCHELAHLKGYILEDEANFIAYLACMQSDNPLFQYSACLSVLGYMVPDLIDAGVDLSFFAEHPVNEYVALDDIFVKQEIMERVEEEAIISTETVSNANEVFLDLNLKANGVEEGIDSYSLVIRLILLYEARMIS